MFASNSKIKRRFGFRTGLSDAKHVSHLRDTAYRARLSYLDCAQQTQCRC
jgi:hypothetical protein